MGDSTMAMLAVVALLAAMILPVFLLLRTQKTAAQDEEGRAVRAAAAEEAAAKKRVARAAEKESGVNKKKNKGLSRMKKAHVAGGDEDEGAAGADMRQEEPEAPREIDPEDKNARREAARRAKEDEREERERLKEEELIQKEETEAKKAQAEYDSWKGMFEVEETGDGGAEAQEEEGLLERFVTTLQTHKVSTLEQLGAEFSLKVADVVSRLRGLEAMGFVTGVIDDRGKFIYISRGELEAVAKFIHKKGRVRISTLAQESNRLIDLSSHEVAVEEEDEGEAGAGKA